MAKMRAIEISKAGVELKLVERDIPTPKAGEVRIKVEACGVCHSDMLAKEGYWPGIQYPRVPGHEVAGRIDEVGDGVTQWPKGQRVGVGWYGGHCGLCEPCRRGKFVLCRKGKITGISLDGGYQEYMIASAQAIAAIPDDLKAEDAAPLLCAGITVFNSMRNAGARAGDLVAIQGIGGLGHLALQYASHMGFDVVAIGTTKDKEPLARKLGAQHYISSNEGDAAAELQKLGGAKLLLATAPDAKSISAMVGGLALDGKLLIVAAPHEPLTINPIALIGGRLTVAGWPSGIATDSEDTMRFSVQAGVKPTIEKFPLEKAADAYQHMITGKARFRAVITMS